MDLLGSVTDIGSTHLPVSVCHHPSSDRNVLRWFFQGRWDCLGIQGAVSKRGGGGERGKRKKASGELRRLLDVISC